MESNVNVFQFQGYNMIVHAKGPHTVRNMTIKSGFHTNRMPSTMNMPRNFAEGSATESTRSLYYGRATSPTMSVRSDFQPRNFHQPFYQGFSQRSTSGRGGSPVSMRTIDSSTSIDIIRAIENSNFNEHEWRAIQLAFKRNRAFSRMAERRRRKRKQYEQRRKQFNDDSGEQASSSSISSDESIITGYSRYSRHKENIPRSISDYRNRDRGFGNSCDDNLNGDYAGANALHPGRTETNSHHVKNMSLYQNMPYLQPGIENRFCPPSNTLSAPRNMLASRSAINGHGNVSSFQKNTLNSSICSMRSLQNQSVTSQRERFQNGFQFPSQRFNRSIVQFQEHDKSRSVQNMKRSNNNKPKQIACLDEDSDENDEIFPDTTSLPVTMETNKLSKKRNIDSLDNIPVTANKKHKSSNKIDETKKQTQTKNKSKEFEFAKPTFPVRKSAPARPKEKLITKSAQFGNITHIGQEENNQPLLVAEPPNQEKEIDLDLAESTQLTTCDMSMRPSFMKRKLFTQTLDVTEQKNNSSESLATDSPQSNIYSELSREKHRTRKLATSQSLLSRDVNRDDNNLLDLIHKIVPPSQVNTSKQPKLSVDKTDDKWDVTSIISTSKNDSVSDTYTDDEIFDVTNNVQNNNNKSKEKPSKAKKKTIEDTKKTTNDKPETNNVPKVTKKWKVVVEKLPQVTPEPPEGAFEACAAKKPISNNSRLNAFWNTDVESDFECGTPAKHKVIQGTQKNIATPKQSTNYIDANSTPATRKSKNIMDKSKTLAISTNDSPLVKTLKKQTNKQIMAKADTKIIKNTKVIITRSGKSDKPKKSSPVKLTKTRIQERNNSSVLKSVAKPRSAKKPAPEASDSKKPTNRKTTERKANKNRSLSDHTKTEINKNQNDSFLLNKVKKIEQRSTSRRKSKTINAQDDSDMQCKVLRTRIVDLSSSFNSDQFELTGISSVRKSRTPINLHKKTKK